MQEGMIYKTQPYLEHARLLFTYTPLGKVTLIAQGSQKLNQKNRVLAQYLTLISFEEKSKNMYILKNATILNDYQTIKNDYAQTKAAAIVLEIIDHIIVDNHDHKLIYNHMVHALKVSDITLSSLAFALKMLKPLGYDLFITPDGRKVKGISIASGGIIYQSQDIPIDLNIEDSIHILKLLKVPYDQLEDIPLENKKNIKQFIYKYYQHHIQTTIKTLQ